MAISAYSATPSANTSISGINIAEGCNASGINDAIRQMMADLAVPQFGSKVGVGMVPVNALDITQSQNASSIGRLTNASTGVSASSKFSCSNGTHEAAVVQFGPSFTTASSFRQDGALFYGDGAGGITFQTMLDGFYWWIGSTRIAVADTTVLQINKNLTTGNVASVANMDALGGQIGAPRGFFVGAGAGIAWDSATFINGTGSTKIQAVVNANGVELLLNASAWSAISDYRAKNLYGEFTGGGEIIDAVPVHLAEYKNKTQPVRPMFLAHEVAEGGAAFAVNGTKDAVDAGGAPVLQSLQSTDPLVPILWAAVRELRAEVAALKAAA